MNKKIIVSSIIVALLLASVLSVSTVFSVPTITLSPSGGDDTAAIHTAIANIDDGGTIYFEAGTFHANIVIDDPDKSFSLVGAGQGVTTLDGNIDGSPGGDGIVLSILNTKADNDIITIIGFTITNGFSTSYGGGAYFDSASPSISNCTFTGNSAHTGAGMYNLRSSPTITYCAFTSNTANNGAGMCNEYDSSPYITSSLFSNNTAYVSGGGMMNNQHAVPLIINCSFSDNKASNYGAGMCNSYNSVVTVQNCWFMYNKSASNGGGMSNYENALALVSLSTFTSNTADNDGGGIFNRGATLYLSTSTINENTTSRSQGAGLYNDSSTVNISNCYILNNTAQTSNGGGMHNEESTTTLENCVVVGNDAHNEGGAMKNVDSSTVTIINSTFTDNTAATGGALFNQRNSSPMITNCILWGNGTEIHNADSNCVPVVTYSDVEGGYAGTGNIDADPLFANAPTDVSLGAGSPCIDAGTTTSVSDDILYVPRPQGGAYDMGAYEYAVATFTIPWSPVSIMPLVRTQLATAHEAWSELSSNLPEVPTDEMNVLVNKIQEHMQNASALTNPIYASGELAKAVENMNSLSMLL